MMSMLHAQQMVDWKSRKNYFGTMESALWINAGPSAYQLQQTMLQIHNFRLQMFSVSSYEFFEHHLCVCHICMYVVFIVLCN